MYELCYYTGMIVSKSVVSRFIDHGFKICGGLGVPNLVPYNKFRPGNIEKAVEYVRTLAKIDLMRLKYINEKSLKGKDICNRLAQQDPMTGITPVMLTDPCWGLYSVGYYRLNVVHTWRLQVGHNPDLAIAGWTNSYLVYHGRERLFPDWVLVLMETSHETY